MTFNKTPNSIINLHNFTDEDRLLHLRKEIISKYFKNLQNTLFLEFGVASGTSLNMFFDLYKQYNINDVDFYGFDSWEGLPCENNDKNNPGYWVEGAYKTTLNNNLIEKFNNNNIQLINGWFSDTLNDSFFEKIKEKKIGILHIDCDIYTSAIQCLEFILKNNLLKSGSIIIYDDWGGYHEKLGEGHDFECGEGKAHLEMMTKYNIDLEFLYKYIIIEKYYEITVFIVK